MLFARLVATETNDVMAIVRDVRSSQATVRVMTQQPGDSDDQLRDYALTSSFQLV